MLQLVGISDGVDDFYPVGNDLERDGMNIADRQSCYTPWQPVDNGGAQIGERLLPLAHGADKKCQNSVAPDDRVERGSSLATSIGVEHRILGKNIRKGTDITGPVGLHERMENFVAFAGLNLKSWSCSPDVNAPSRCELAAAYFITSKKPGNLIEADVENVMQQEGCALERRQPFQRQHQSDG